MQRRKFLVGMGSLAAGGAAAMGTGAFTEVSANRDMEIAVTGDASALLEITPAEKPNGDLHENAKEYVITENDDTIALDFTGSSEGANGLNKDAKTIIDALLDFKNMGTQPINVGEADPDGHPGSFYAEGDLTDGEGDSFDVDDWDNDGQVVSTNIGAGETVQNVGWWISNPDELFSSNGSKTWEVTFQATRVGGDRV